jgi:hypothetical protein
MLAAGSALGGLRAQRWLIAHGFGVGRDFRVDGDPGIELDHFMRAPYVMTGERSSEVHAWLLRATVDLLPQPYRAPATGVRPNFAEPGATKRAAEPSD